MTKEIEELIEAAKSLIQTAPEMHNQMTQDAFDRVVDAIKAIDLAQARAARKVSEK